MLLQPEVQSFLRDHAGAISNLPSRQQAGPVRGSVVPQQGTLQGTLGYQLGGALPDVAGDRAFLRPVGNFLGSLGTDPGKSLMYGLLAGGLGGLGASFASGRPSIGKTLLGAGLGGLGAYGLSSYLQNRPENYGKQAAFLDPSVNMIRAGLMADPSLRNDQRSLLSSLVGQLPEDKVQQLANLMRGSAGAGIGFLVAKYLLGLGIGGTALLSILGAAAGLSFGGGPRDVEGRSVNTRQDLYGGARFV